jgi:hypothetical protein
VSNFWVIVREHHPGARFAVLVDLTVDVVAGGEKNIGRCAFRPRGA